MDLRTVRLYERCIALANIQRKAEAVQLAKELRSHVEKAAALVKRLETEFPDIIADVPPQADKK